MLERLGYVVEIPIWPAQARERDLPGHIAKLLLYALAGRSADKVVVANDLANWVSRCIKPGENIYACPLVPYLSDKRMKNFLSTYALADRTVRVNLYYLIRCDSATAIASILQHCGSEITVLIISKTEATVRDTLLFLDEYPGDYKSFEVPLMDRVPVHEGFIFAADGHASLEVLGTEQFILRRCLSPLLKGQVT